MEDLCNLLFELSNEDRLNILQQLGIPERDHADINEVELTVGRHKAGADNFIIEGE